MNTMKQSAIGIAVLLLAFSLVGAGISVAEHLRNTCQVELHGALSGLLTYHEDPDPGPHLLVSSCSWGNCNLVLLSAPPPTNVQKLRQQADRLERHKAAYEAAVNVLRHCKVGEVTSSPKPS